MRNKILLYLILMLAVPAPLHILAKERLQDKGGVELSVVISDKDVYVGEPVIVRLEAYSPNYEVGYVKSLGNASYGDADVRVSVSPNQARLEGVAEWKGKKAYKVLLNEVVLFPTSSGTLDIKLPDMEIGLVDSESIDPFWGMFMRPDMIPVRFLGEANDKIKVRALPSANKKDFSGAVGEFDFEATLPPGEIVKGREGTLLYEISGVGSLEDVDTLPFEKLFPSSVEIKSIVPQEKMWINQEGKLASTKTYEITFIPQELGVVEIEPMEFVFFNPTTKKYVTKTSSAVSFEVEEVKTKKQPQVPVYI